MNVLDYLRWRGDLTFSQAPFNEVDNLALAQISFIDWTGIVPPPGHGSVTLMQAADQFFAVTSIDEVADKYLNLRDYYVMAQLMSRTNRFRNMRLLNYSYSFDAAKEEQFGAVTAALGDGTLYVSFRGTDSTIVGWKEDFNIAVMCPTPSQRIAADYLNWVIDNSVRRVRVGGHSKGGNLAMYAAAMVKDHRRIIHVYNNDGPGFTPAFIKSQAFISIRPLIRMFIPQTSVIGLLMCNDAPRHVVLSDSKDVIWQHNGYSWQVERDHFIYLPSNTDDAKTIDRITDSWVYNISTEDKMVFFNTVYDLLVENGIKTLDDMNKNMLRLAPKVLEKFKDFSPGEKELFTEMVMLFVRISGYDIKERFIRPTPKTVK